MKTFKGTECFQGTTPKHLCLISLYQSKLSLLAQDIHVPNCHYQSCGLQERKDKRTWDFKFQLGTAFIFTAGKHIMKSGLHGLK